MYKYSCYIENTKEAREWLENIGHFFCRIGGVKDKYIVVGTLGYAFIDNYNGRFERVVYKDHINCLGNLPLFKALTAVRDDSDIKQWFTNGELWCKCHLKDFNHFAIIQKEEPMMAMLINWHKATDKELIEKFKRKEL